MKSNSPSIPRPSEEDSQLVKDYLLHTIILDVLERDIHTLHSLALKMPDLYIRSLRRIQNEVTLRLTDVRKLMRLKGIKVYEEVRTKTGIEASYLCRGYHLRFTMMWSFIKAEVQSELSRYLGIQLTEDN
ncbi:hypothetical protein PASE110613_02250 [Paenibacillus sediminis]|uniref:Transcriptional regulator n=1 Tax=Paenibacillus sediminis TaxID=664909 RepID=A0ABS4H0E9_9BACL|nr:hypothetical protein [Paenibacillus sediminis]MBP1935590.1 hypothetical protein [Paenibacillus sediminis]